MIQTDQPAPETRCANCGLPLQSPYCAQCGEKRLEPGDLALPHLLKELAESLTHADSRLLRSFKYLLIRPGFLTAEYLRGRRKPYLKPLAFFLIINLVYFLTIDFNDVRTFETPLQLQYGNPYGHFVTRILAARLAGATPEESAAFEAAFNLQNHALSKSMLLLLAPLLAMPLWLLFRRRRYVTMHFVTALHFLSLQIVFNMLIGIFLKGGLTLFFFGYSQLTHFIGEVVEPLLWFGVFAYISLKTVYGESRRRTLWKTALLALFWFPVIFIYRFIVFLMTIYTI